MRIDDEERGNEQSELRKQNHREQRIRGLLGEVEEEASVDRAQMAAFREKREWCGRAKAREIEGVERSEKTVDEVSLELLDELGESFSSSTAAFEVNAEEFRRDAKKRRRRNRACLCWHSNVDEVSVSIRRFCGQSKLSEL